AGRPMGPPSPAAARSPAGTPVPGPSSSSSPAGSPSGCPAVAAVDVRAGGLVCAVVALAGGHERTGRPNDLAVVGESTRLRADDPYPATTPWFDGRTVHLVAARGEVLGLQIRHRDAAAVSLALAAPGVAVDTYAVESFEVRRPSTALYGGSRGAGRYA